MSIFSTRIVAGLFAAGLLACAPAHAAYGNASVELNNIKFELIDLDLNDSITPSIFFAHQVTYGYLSYHNDGQHSTLDFAKQGVYAKDFINGSYRASNTPGSLLAEAHGTSATGSMDTWLYLYQKSYFTLSPSTRLVFSADAAVSMDHDEPFARRNTLAGISAEVEWSNKDSSGKDRFAQSLFTGQEARTQSLSGFIETGKHVGTGILAAQTQVQLYYNGSVIPPSPVPEPATYGMLAMGLMVLGGAVRRKARTA